MKGICISGGGCKGSFATGVVVANKKEYDHYSGSSVGALVAILIASGKHDLLKVLMTSMDNNSIYDSNPFNKKGKLNRIKTIIRQLRRIQGIGSTKKLLKLIRKSYTKQDHKDVQREGKEIVVTVVNLTMKTVEYKYNYDWSWEDFTYWVWISTLAYPYAETVYFKGYEYGDGGYGVNLPVEMSDKVCKSLDVIVLSTEGTCEEFENKNLIQGVPSMIDTMLIIQMNELVKRGKELTKDKPGIWVFTPYNLTDSSMFFDKNKMNEWFELGTKEKL